MRAASGAGAGSSTSIGCLAAPARVEVDPRGLVVAPEGWCVDWWIGTDDRWRHPAEDPSVRQRLVDLTPVVETAMRVPGGDALQRVWAVSDPDLGAIGVIEVDNRSPAPFSLAIRVGPSGRAGAVPIARVDLDGEEVLVDGRVTILLPTVPSRMARPMVAGDDLVAASAHAPMIQEPRPSTRGDPGRSEAAFVFPVAHGASVRVVLRLDPDDHGPRSGWGRRAGRAPAGRVPGPDAVARSWRALTERGLRVVLPAGPVADAFHASQGHLLLAAQSVPAGACPDAVLAACERMGRHAEAAEVLAAAAACQRRDGRIEDPADGADITTRVLAALGDHWRLSGDSDLLGPLVPAVALAAGWVRRSPWRERHPRRDGVTEDGPGLMALLRRVRALLDAAEVLDALGEHDAGATVGSWAAALRANAERPMAVPSIGVDLALVEACWPLGLRPATGDDVVLAASSLGLLAERERLGGCSPATVLSAAVVDAMAGRPGAGDKLARVLEHASATCTWPARIGDPGVGADRDGGSPDAGATAALCTLVRTMLVHEVPGGLSLCAALPGGWLGHGIEVHDAPTAWGLLSFALRWHGERPALLWELRPRGHDPVHLRAPSLDPTWSSGAARGEALLAPPGQAPPPRATPAAPGMWS